MFDLEHRATLTLEEQPYDGTEYVICIWTRNPGKKNLAHCKFKRSIFEVFREVDLGRAQTFVEESLFKRK